MTTTNTKANLESQGWKLKFDERSGLYFGINETKTKLNYFEQLVPTRTTGSYTMDELINDITRNYK